MCLMMMGCESVGPGVYGGSVAGDDRPTRVVVSTDGPVGLGDIAKVAKTVRKYRNLNASEAEILRALAQQKFDGLVVREMKRLERKYEAKKVQVKAKAKKRVAKVRRDAVRSTAKAPPEKKKVIQAAAVQEEKVIIKEQNDELEQLEQQLRKEAVASTIKKHGSNIVISVENPDKKAVAAFASVSPTGVASLTSKSTYELDVSLTSIARVSGDTQVATVNNKDHIVAAQ